MSKPACCLDTSVLVKVLVPEEGSEEAEAVLKRAIQSGFTLVAPAFARAEVATVLKKKVRAGLVSVDEGEAAWKRFLSLCIKYVDDWRTRETAWRLASEYDLPTRRR